MDKWDNNLLNKNGIGWRFPSNDHGNEVGFGDAGIETFKNDIHKSNARENTQNSLDARYDDRPVEIHFKLDTLPISFFPQVEKFKEVLSSCKKYWKSKENYVEILDNALKTMNSDTITVLKVSDYNTTGLLGSRENERSQWKSLIRQVGVSEKPSGSGGSFGIGKHAPFACSKIRTVFYGTKDIDGNVAFQGKSMLVTHLREDGETTQGTGFYGIEDQNKPIFDFSLLPEYFKRDRCGTDIFIMGFNASEGWEEKVIKTILEDFFIAIKEGKLVVEVNDTRINQNTIYDLMEKFSQEGSWPADKYYSVYCSEESIYKSISNFEGMGEIELRLLTGKNFPKKVAMFRATGMKIFDMDRFMNMPIRFAGVFVAKGELINDFLRICEPPEHNKWVADRYEKNPKRAKDIINKIKRWIRDEVKALASQGEAEECDVEGMSQFLPDDMSEHIDTQNTTEVEGEKNTPAEIQLRSHYRDRVQPKASEGIPVTEDELIDEGGGNSEGKSDFDNGDEAEGDTGGGGTNRNDTSGGSGGSGAGDGHGNRGVGNNDGNSEPKDGNNGGGAPESKGRKTPKIFKRIDIQNIRAFSIDANAGIYSISFVPQVSAIEGLVELQVLGDTDDEPAPIKSAKLKESVTELPYIGNGKIGSVSFNKGQKITLEIKLACNERCAMGVNAYANEVS